MDQLKAMPREQKLFIGAGGMALFLVSLLFLKWFGLGLEGLGVDSSVKATKAIDSWWIALVLAVVALAILLAEAVRFEIPVPGATTSVAFVAAFLVLFWTLTHVIDLSGLKIGAWLALVGSIVGTAGAWLARADDRR